MKIKMQMLVCKVCGYTWYPRKTDVRLCPSPKCHSPYWDTDRAPKVAKEGK